jgi:hypothetical protein
MSALIDLVWVLCSGRLRWQTLRAPQPGDYWIRWDSIVRTHIFWPFGLLSLWDTSYGPWSSQRQRMTWQLRFLGLAMVVQVIMAMRNLLGNLWLVAAASASGVTTRENFKVLSYRVKFQGLTLIDCVWQLPCWRHYFMSENRVTTTLLQCFLLGGVAIGEAGLLMLSWWFVPLLQGLDQCNETFLLCKCIFLCVYL